MILWLLRLALAPRSTITGFRDWVITDCPVAPGARPGHLAELAAVRQGAEQHLALVSAERDEAVGHAAARVRQARTEAERAQGAAAAVRAELDRVRHESACARTDTARLFGEVRDSAAARVAALEEARAELRARAEQAQADARTLRAERDRLSEQLRTAAVQPGPAPRSPARSTRRSGPTKRDRMIRLAEERHDLASVPMREVSGLASALAAEIGYSPGTARRELIRHVREIQSGAADTAATGQEGGTNA